MTTDNQPEPNTPEQYITPINTPSLAERMYRQQERLNFVKRHAHELLDNENLKREQIFRVVEDINRPNHYQITVHRDGRVEHHHWTPQAPRKLEHKATEEAKEYHQQANSVEDNMVGISTSVGSVEAHESPDAPSDTPDTPIEGYGSTPELQDQFLRNVEVGIDAVNEFPEDETHSVSEDPVPGALGADPAVEPAIAPVPTRRGPGRPTKNQAQLKQETQARKSAPKKKSQASVDKPEEGANDES